MADRQRSFADMFPDLMGSLTQGAQWKRAMKPSTEKERDRQLTPEDRKWLKERRMQDWLDKQGNLLSPQDPAIAPQVLEYMMKVDPRRSMMKGFQKFILPKLSKMTRRRQKRQMKDRSETRRSADYGFEEGLREGEQQPSMEQYEAHEQVLDRMGYNPTDKPITGRKYPTREVGEPRSPEDHAQDLAERFLISLREKDARDIQTIRETRPDPDMNLDDYIRWVGQQGQEASRREESGLPRRRRDPERFEQVDKAMQARNRSLKDAEYKLLRDKWRKDLGSTEPILRVNPLDKNLITPPFSERTYEQAKRVDPSGRDLMSRVFGRRLSRDIE